MPPAVAVVMPTYNQCDYIAHSIRSVVEQEHQDWTLLISDNASTDDTLDAIGPFLADPRVRLLRNTENLGIVRNWTNCFAHVPEGTDHIVLLPSDDVMRPDHLGVTLQRFEHFPEAAVVHCDAAVIDSTGRQTRDTYFTDPKLRPGVSNNLPFLVQKNFVLCPGVALDRSKLRVDLLELFAPAYPISHDWRAWLHLMLSGHQFVYSGEATMRFRVHEGQVTQPSRFGASHREVMSYLGEMATLFPEHRDLLRAGVRRQAMSVALNGALSYQPRQAIAAVREAVAAGQGSFVSKDLVAAAKFSTLARSIARLRVSLARR